MGCFDPVIAYMHKTKWTEEGKHIVFFSEPFDSENYEQIEIRCGRCLGCRMDYSQMWAARMTHEAAYHKNNWFLTLTYNDEHLPMRERINTETGELQTSKTLVKGHVQEFIKRLREKYTLDKQEETRIRYYACGEYGPKGGRPHYHLAIFNAPIVSLEKVGVGAKGSSLYTSPEIERLWNKGFITIGELTPASAGYIARYMLKKQKGDDKKYYEEENIQAPFTLQSTMPGLGFQYYDEHKEEIYMQDCIILATQGRSRKIPVPAYYDKQMEKENPTRIREIKEHRAEAGRAEKIRLQRTTNINRSEYLRNKEAALKNKASKLIRSIE